MRRHSFRHNLWRAEIFLLFSVQGHHYRPRTQSSYSRSPSHEHGRHGSHSVTPAPPMLSSRVYTSFPSFAPMLKGSTESESNAYMMVPITAHTASEYQQPYATQLGYGPTPTFPNPVPSPTPAANAAHGIPSPRFLPTANAPPALSTPALVQTRALHVPHILHSQPRKSPLAQGVGPQKATADGRHSHPLFRHSRCTGHRKAVCVRVPTRCF